MTVINVAGTSLQTAINNAQPGDTIVPKAGGYAGRLTITKPLTIAGDGGAILDGGATDGFVNVLVQGAKVIQTGLDYRHGGCAVRFLGDCSGSQVLHYKVPVVDHVVVNSATGWGGNAFACSQGSKGIEIAYGEIRSCRAPSAVPGGVDGGSFEMFEASGLWFHHNEVWDCVNIAESGKNAGGPDNTGILIEDNVFHGRANPLTPATQAIVANGMFLRALTNSKIRRNVFDRIDWWSVLFSTSGGYAGAFSGVEVTDNTFLVLPGVNRMVTTDAGTVLAAFLADRNKVFAADASTVVAEINKVRYLAKDLAAFRTATGWEKTSPPWVVGPLPAAPPVPVPPLPPVPVPVDPCAAQLAQAQTDLATANAAVTATAAQRDAAKADLAAATTALGQANAEVARLQVIVTKVRADVA